MAEYVKTKWHTELDIFHKIKPVIVMEGNIMDSFQYPTDGTIASMPDYLTIYLEEKGYQMIVGYDSIQGFYELGGTLEGDVLETFHRISQSKTKIEHDNISVEYYDRGTESQGSGSVETAPIIAKRALENNEIPTAIIMNLASRYITCPDNLSQEETDSFTNLLLAADQAAEVDINEGSAKNLLILLVNKTNDLPAWFCMNNPNIKILYVSAPTVEERSSYVEGNFAAFFDREIYEAEIGAYDENPQELDKLKDKFVGLTEGFTFREMEDLRKLCRNEKLHISKMADAIDLYRYGPKENPWTRQELRENLKRAEEQIRERVKGQDVVVNKALNVVKRAAVGMSGLQHSSHTKPKGILFFAGPTGTGKTELTKALAELLFGDERRCIRFDMSEYSQPASDQKLLGAPPGYVGYEAGGQLTNAVRENPFSILLFDEIEKAHGSIFDKFLQILEDGRMTDGQGKTVYFSESIIVFTSNLGIYTTDKDGVKHQNVSSNQPYAEIEKRVRTAVEDHFKLQLGRPEILNRIGENILVFDFIREEVAVEILAGQVKKIIRRLKTDNNIDLTIEDQAMQTLQKKVFGNLDNGGRGVGNVVEEVLINPLAKYLFDEDLLSGVSLVIEDFVEENNSITLKVRKEA